MPEPKEKRPRGQPPKPPEEVCKHLLQIKVTEADMQKAEAKAGGKRSIAKWVRGLIRQA